MFKNAFAVALGLVLAQSASAALVFDPDGTGPLGSVSIDNFDWGKSSFLSKGGNTAISNFVANFQGGLFGTAGELPTTFDTYYHAALSTLKLGDSAVVVGGLDSTFEITVIAGFGERVTSVFPTGPNSNVAFFESTPGGVRTGGLSPFIQIFFDSTPDRHQVSGSGYGDGELILSADLLVSGTPGLFQQTDNRESAQKPLDNKAPDDFAGFETLPGSGNAGTLVFGDIWVNPDFFKTAIPGTISINVDNTSINLPYDDQIDPSDCFNAPGSLCDDDQDDADPDERFVATDGPFVPDLSANNVNGSLANPDFLASTDTNSRIDGASVPEPGTLALLGLGLVGMASRRRQQGV